MRKPLPLRKGDVIAICAPAGPVDASRLDRGIARLRKAGFVPEVADGVLASEGYLAGGDAHRARQFEWALTLPEGRAVMAARGGYGTARILPLVDWKRAVRHRKLIVGFSDLTAVLSYLSTRVGFPCLHGPMAAADLALRFDPEALDAFARLAAGAVSAREPWGESTEWVRRGAAEGVLAGGCLSVITGLLGTPYEPDFRGAILFLEDVGEPAYRIDRMLTQWVQSGRLSKIAGILVGKMAPARGESEDGIRCLFHDVGKRLAVPVRYGFPAGHDGKNVSLPFGVRVRIDAKGRLFLLESPVETA
jgi:muramoyltetrapeptide carboxypeptidase